MKVGISDDPPRRARHLGIMLLVEPGGIHEERALHARFRLHRIDGEWYHLAPEIIAYLVDRAGRQRSTPASAAWRTALRIPW